MSNTFYLLLLIFCSQASLFAQTKSIILGRPTDKTITVSAYFDQNVEFYVEYGTKTGEYAARTANILNKAKTPQSRRDSRTKPQYQVFLQTSLAIAYHKYLFRYPRIYFSDPTSSQFYL